MSWLDSRFSCYALGILALTCLAGCDITTEGIQDKPLALEEVFPPSKSVASYRQVGKPKTAAAADMATQLGGKHKLEVLRKWSAFSSQFCDYGLPDKPPRVRVTVTEMNSKVDAYGSYTNIRPGLLPESQYVKVGVHGTIDGERLLFVQDRYIIAIRDLEQTPEEQRRALLVNFARAISNRMPKPILNIDPVSFLPVENRVTASERMDKEDPLGAGVFQKGAVSALYRVGESGGKETRECKVFLTHTAQGIKFSSEMKALKAVMDKEQTVLEVDVGDRGYKGLLHGRPCMVAQREDIVFGALGTYKEEEMLELLVAIDRRIKPLAVLQYKDLQEQKRKEKEKEEKGGGSGYQFTP